MPFIKAYCDATMAIKKGNLAVNVICPFCTTELETDEELQDGRRLECPNCQKKFEYSYAVQQRFLEIRENVKAEAATEQQRLRMR